MAQRCQYYFKSCASRRRKSAGFKFFLRFACILVTEKLRRGSTHLKFKAGNAWALVVPTYLSKTKGSKDIAHFDEETGKDVSKRN